MCILRPHSHVMLNCRGEAGKSLSYLYMMSDQAPEEALYVVLYGQCYLVFGTVFRNRYTGNRS